MRRLFTLKLSWINSKLLWSIYLMLFGAAQLLHASDLMEVSPITNKFLMIYIKDGHIDSYGSGQSISDNVTYINATNLSNATNKSNYVISSTNDGNYTTTKNPINLGRKSKAVDYNDEWQTIPYVWGHWIYIELPTAMVQGKSYTVQLNNIVENKNSLSFVYDVNKIRSETVHVNLVGFPQSGPKYAYLSQWMGDFNAGVHTAGGLELDDKAGAQFRVVNYATGVSVYSGTIAKRMDKSVQETGSGDYGDEKNYTHADVWECNFSSYTTPGEYVIAVDGIGCSYPFEIGNETTREPFYYAMKGLFWQRHGIVKQMENGKIMPRDHHPDDIVWKWDANWAGGEDASGFNTSSPRVYGIYGYYHDAGDWDGYVWHAKVPMSLLLLYDLAPDKFKDGDLDNKYKLKASDANWIDESNNGVPDLLDEASWLIKYYQRVRNVIKNNYGGTGGVPAYVGRDAIPANNITAWDDTREWYLSAENLQQTYFYAGLASWYAICLNKYHQLTNSGNHPEYTTWMNEATAAWNWANAKTINTDDERRARGFAAANMYRATANTTYQTAFVDYYNFEPSKGDGEWANPNIYDVAISIYSLIPTNHNGLNSTLQNSCKSEIQTKASGTKVDNLNANAMRVGIENYQFFQLGSLNTPRMTLLPVAHYLTNDSKYLDAMKNANNYVLGGNQQNMAYLSGLSERSDIWVFNPNGWLTNNYNSKVYSNEPNIGYTTYFGALNYWFYNSSNSEYFSRTAAYPQAKDFPNSWPESESKFYNRYSIQGGEFTIHQQSNYMIYNMGYVRAMSSTSSSKYVPNAKPTLTLNLTDNQGFPSSGCDLTVTASGDMRSVKYYYEWHYIGESFDKANNFKLSWTPLQGVGTTLLITAVGYDDRGVHTDPSDAGDKTVTISSSATCQVGSSCSGTGGISHLRYEGLSGTAISDLTSASKYPNSPDFTSTLTSFETGTDILDNYGVMLRGYICPPSTGSYTFWIAGDDAVELWLSTNNSSSNKQKIAYHSAWTGSREWNKYGTQKSVSITLTAGQNYYVEALMKEGAGGDNLAVGWSKPGQSTASPSEVIPGSSLIPFSGTPVTYTLTTNASNGSVSKSPNQANYNSGSTVTLTATANSGYAFSGWSGDASGSTNPLSVTMNANKSITANFTVVSSSCSGTGTITYQRFESIGSGVSVSDLTSASKYPNSPDYTVGLTSFEAPTDVLDNYGTRIIGYICPPETGTYYFWIAGDDNVQLNLSTNDQSTSKVTIASHTSWTGSKEWNKFTSQKSSGISLTAGQLYYVEALMKEGGGGDNLAVGWRKPSDGNSTSPVGVIPGSALKPYSGGTLPSGATHQWKFNNNGTDNLGSNNATLLNGAVYTTSTVKEGSHALNLGVSGSANATVGVLNLTTTFTVTMWAYNTGDQVHQNWLMCNTDGNNLGFRLFVNSYGGTDGKISFENLGSSSSDYSTSASGAFGFNQWNHVALAVGSGSYIIYINGTSVHSGTVQTGVNFNRELFIGSMGDSNNWNTWKGYLDNIKVYNKKLTQIEVSSEFGSGLRQVQSEDLISVQNDMMNIFPNPVVQGGLVNLSIQNIETDENLSINVYSISGQSVFNAIASSINGTFNYTISAEKLGGSGMYFIKIEGSNRQWNKKLLIRE